MYLFVCLYLIGESVKLVPFRGIFCPTALVWRLLRRLSDKKQEYFPSVTNCFITMFRIAILVLTQNVIRPNSHRSYRGAHVKHELGVTTFLR